MDIYSVSTPLLWVSRVICLCPFSISGEVGTRRVQLSKGNIVYSLVVIALLFWSQLSNTTDINRPSDDTSRFTFAATYIQNILEASVAALNVLICIFKVQNSIDFLADFNLFDLRLASYFNDLSMDYQSATRHSFLQAMFSVAFLLGSAGWVTYLWQTGAIYVEFWTNWGKFWAANFASNAITIMSALQFMVYSYVLRQRFTLLNTKLDGFLDLGGADKFITSTHPQFSRKDELVETISKIKSLHSRLCDLASELNALYGLQILFLVGVAFANITTNLNQLFETVRNELATEEGVDTFKLVIAGLTVYEIAILFGVISCVALSCSSTCNQANNISVSVHSLRAQWFDRQVGERLETFSLQLLHRRLTFTAFGFFPINQTMIHSFVGSVTTYLVILIQFQLSLSPAKK